MRTFDREVLLQEVQAWRWDSGGVPQQIPSKTPGATYDLIPKLGIDSDRRFNSPTGK
jgi:hypothetical protein